MCKGCLYTFLVVFYCSSYERFERYRLRAMRAQIANQNPGNNHPALPAITQSNSPPHQNQLQLQHGPSSPQTNQLLAPINHLSLPSTSTDHPPNSSVQQKDDDVQSDEDDDELLDAVAEQAQVVLVGIRKLTPIWCNNSSNFAFQRNESANSNLAPVDDWTDSTLALQALRITDSSHVKINNILTIFTASICKLNNFFVFLAYVEF